MNNFNQVTVVKKANIYFDGNVTSRTVILEDNSKVTLGIMQPGTYEFGTQEKEVFEILGGVAKVLLPKADKWEEYEAGATFTVPPNSTFEIVVSEVLDYCCSYVKE